MLGHNIVLWWLDLLGGKSGHVYENKYKKARLSYRNYIHKTACVETDKLGDGNLVFEQAYVGMYAEFGNGSLLVFCRRNEVVVYG